MNKPKRKNEQQEFRDKVLDAALLAKPFEYEVDLSVSESAERIRNLARPRTGFLFAWNQEIKVIQGHNLSYDFEIRLNRYGRGFTPTNTAKVTGTIWFDAKTDTTAVRGETRLGIITLLFIVGIVLGTIEITQSRDVPSIILLFAIALISFLPMLWDYRKLHYLIRDTFSPDGEGKIKHDG